jgi:hypothetical protein
VTSTGQGDGTEAITWQEFKGAIPRIIMGMIIALTISKPIEIRIFQPEIEKEISVMINAEQDSMKRVIHQKYSSDVQNLDSTIVKMETEINDAFRDFKIAEKNASDELDGQAGSTEEGDGPIYQAKLVIQNKAEKKYKNLEKKYANPIERAKNRKNDLEKLEEEELGDVKANSEKMSGLLLRMQLAHKIAGWEISIFITLLFMVIELTPIFFKLMLIKGPYDFFSDNIKELARAEQGIEIQHEFYKESRNGSRHKTINHTAEVKFEERKQILDAQREINKKIIEKWKAKMFKDIDDNPDKYTSED